MKRSIVALIAGAVALVAPAASRAEGGTCIATPGSMTPASWREPMPRAAAGVPEAPLHVVLELPLTGPANRFDYQSFDPQSGRLYMNHMNAGRLVVFDADAGKVITEVPGLPRATGVWAVPSRHRIYVSAAGNHELAVIDDSTFQVVARVGGISFPDGIAYVPGTEKVFVSDENGGADVVIDAKANTKRSTIALGGEAGNTHYDSVSHCIVVAVQTKDQLVAIDPASEKIIARYDTPGCEEPHGFTLDEPGRLAFVSCQGNARLLVWDLRAMKVRATFPVGATPDVLAWDASWRRLYVATEGGVLNVFAADGADLRPLVPYRAPHVHTVAVDPRTHRVYVPLENVDGRPLLRVLAP